MYPVIIILFLIIGVLLFVFAKKIANGNKPLMVFIKVLGGVFVILGLIAMYLILSEKIILPLKKLKSGFMP